MSYGYSKRVSNLNRQANRASLGVKLGRVCIKQDISVAEVATQLGVSRQTVYNWFVGTHVPHTDLDGSIRSLLTSYK
jgi:DNA-binding XRE family transcriptional regulator